MFLAIVKIQPNHFLIGSSSIAKPPGLFIEKKWNFKKQWEFAQTLSEKFWNRWLKEYLPTLTKRTKWYKNNKSLEPNDLVVLADNRLPRNNWPVGRVIKVYKGSDGHVRVADVKTKIGIYRRPVSKVCSVDCLEMGEEACSSRGGEMLSSACSVAQCSACACACAGAGACSDAILVLKSC